MDRDEKLFLSAFIFSSGFLLGGFFYSKIIERKPPNCFLTSDQVLNELDKMPIDVSSANVVLEFIKHNGRWATRFFADRKETGQ